MKNFKQFIIFISFFLVAICGVQSETLEGAFWTLVIMGVLGVAAYDAGMLEMPKKGGDNGK